MILVFVLFALFASVFVISKEALFHGAPFFLIGSRMLIAGGLFLLFAFIRERKWVLPKKRALFSLFLLAFFNIYLTNVCEFWGLKYLSSSKTCFLYSLSPFVSALLSFLLFREKLSSKKWLGLGVGIVGLMPLLLSQTSLEESVGTLLCFSLPELSVLVAVFASAYGWILLRQLVAEEGLSPLYANGFSMLLGGLMALLHSGATETWNPLPVTHMYPFALCFIALLVISNGLAYNLAGAILKRFSATFFSFAGLTTPVFTALFAFFAHKEVPEPAFWISYAFIILGLVIFYYEETAIKKIAT